MSESNGHKTIKTADVVFREDLYPRIETSAVTVQKYAEDLDVLPPIEVNQRNELIDGWHRWTAHKKNGAETIRVTVTETKSDADLLEKAIVTNSTHGLQLSQQDKKDMARRIYHSTPERERDATKNRLASILSVSERTVRDWLSRIDKDAKEARDRRIFDLWLACWTQQEIADELACDQKEVSRTIDGFSQNGKSSVLTKSDRAAADHATDFEPPIYNVWKRQDRTPGQSDHFGYSDVRWLDNLLYLYTSPFDVVIDPFAGGGSTIDLCRKRFRRYCVSDRKPIIEREKEIRRHDLTNGLPKPPQWKDVRLVYLDPPYWKQAEGQYSNDPSDLGNMDLSTFTKTLAKVISDYAAKLDNAYIALIIQPTQVDAIGTREIQALMFLEVKTRGGDIHASQLDTLVKTHLFIGRRKRKLGKQLIRHYGVSFIFLSNTDPDNSDRIVWGRFDRRKGSEYEVIRTEVTKEQLVKLLRFDIDPDNFEPQPFRRHHKNTTIVQRVKSALGFEYDEIVIKRS